MRGISGNWCPALRHSSRKRRRKSSPMSRSNSFAWPSTPSFLPGSGREPSRIGGSMGFPTRGARPSTWWRWYSATWGKRAAPVWRSRADPATGDKNFFGECSDECPRRGCRGRHQDSTSGRVRSRRTCRRPTRNWSTLTRNSKSITGTCSIWSSRSKRASSTCCKPGSANGPASLP